LVGSPALRMTTFIGFHRAAKAVGTYATGLASDSSPTVFTFPATPMIVNGLLSILSSPTALSMGSSFGQNLRAISSLMMVTCDPVPSLSSNSRPRSGILMVRKYTGLTMRQSAEGLLPSGGAACPSIRTSPAVLPPPNGTPLVIPTDCIPGSAAVSSSRSAEHQPELQSLAY